MAVLLASCQEQPRCEGRVEGARREAVLSASACVWNPERLATADCAGRNPEPLNAWYATWCGLATVTCIRDTPAAMEVCFGRPDTGLAGARE